MAYIEEGRADGRKGCWTGLERGIVYLIDLSSASLPSSLSLFQSLGVVHLTHLIGLARPPCLRSFILFNSIFCCLLLLPIFVLLLLSRPFLRALLLRYTNTYVHTNTQTHTHGACGFTLR